MKSNSNSNSNIVINQTVVINNFADNENDDAGAKIPLINHKNNANSNEKVETKASFASCVFNLTNTTVGAGVLTLPSAFQTAGIVVGALLLLVTAILCSITHMMLIKAAHKSGKFSYRDVVIDAFGPKSGVYVDGMIAFYTTGTLIAYPIIIGNNLQSVMEEWLSDSSSSYDVLTDRLFIMSIAVFLIILPLCLLPNLDPLRFISLVAVACIMYVIIILVYTAGVGTTEMDLYDIEYVNTNGIDMFLAFPLISVSLTAHYNVISIYKEMEYRSVDRMKNVVIVSVFVIFCLYLITAVSGYYAFREDTESDVLENLDSSRIRNSLARFALSITIIFSYPLVHFATRNAYDGLIWKGKAYEYRRWVWISLVLVPFSLLIAYLIPDIRVVFSFTGSTLGTVVVYILPGLVSLKHSGEHWKHPTNRLACFVIGFGVIFGILGFIVAILNVI